MMIIISQHKSKYGRTSPHQPDQNTIVSLTVQLQPYRRILMWGESGSGKSTLAIALLHQISKQQTCLLMELDPGSPPFGVPGAVSIGRIRKTEHYFSYKLLQLLPYLF